MEYYFQLVKAKFVKLTGDRLSVLVFDHPGAGIRLSGFRPMTLIATGRGHVRRAVRRSQNRSVARRVRMFLVEKSRRDRRKRLMRHAHVPFTNVQGFHELLRSTVQILQRYLQGHGKRCRF